ncbi:Ribosomal large subunit pseudouridine synthase A [Grifola frondosa]|uniref:21S rRNA pseudouridine(2819) synthase n=1 Tax=Grifola frondosa TaxID=5627 RepID=A0A1C7MDK3_GRIFR|nr:Ribosomal large subunit pseudouridine synthase A [Grifola frondosa]
MLPRLASKSIPYHAKRTASTSAKCALYVDRGILVANKPPGLVCQFDHSHSDPTTQRFAQFVNDLQQQAGIASSTIDPVHRLDKTTTGSLAFGLSPHHTREISRQFRSREVKKTYLALVFGSSSAFATKTGTVREELRCIDGRIELAKPTESKKSSKDDVMWTKPAVTEWEIVASSTTAPLTLIRLHPQTGLKHQLRVHLAQCLSTPILGDTLYAHKEHWVGIAKKAGMPINHVHLHASELSFFRYRLTGANRQVRIAVRAPLPHWFVHVCHGVGIQLHVDDLKGGLWVNGTKLRGGPLVEEDADAEAALEGVGGRWLGK